MKERRAEKKRKRDYRDILPEIGMYLMFTLILYLFYKSVFAFILLVPAVLFYHRYYKKELEKKHREILNMQFKDALLSIAGALRAGYSMENALPECRAEMDHMYGGDSPIGTELRKMQAKLSLGVPLEIVFREFAEESGVSDIATFAEVFSIAKRTGGDLVEIIQKTASDIASKIDTAGEIAVVVRAKRLEQNIMSLMPALIILYVDLTAGSILAPLYQSLMGRVIMTVCLGIYIGAFFLGRKIMKIEV